MLSLFLLSLIIPSVLSCADHGDGSHDHSKRSSPPSPKTFIAPPTTPLTWGELNFIHTTDSHGWLLGHQKASSPEPNSSGDLGDFAGFVERMREQAVLRGVDLLLIDSGDLHDGNGLTDGFPPGGVDAHDANQFLVKLGFDIMAIGNHELYIYANTLDMHTNFAPQLKGRYLSSNVNITVADKKTGQPVSVPVGERFVKFKTRLGKKVTALGVLFNFTDNDKNTTVQPVADMITEPWFSSAIKDEPDFFLLVGHMPVQKDNWPLVFNAVRAVHPTTPIFIFGGHTHIRDCVQLDARSMSLESGRYMETVGWMSVKSVNPKGPKTTPLTFTRRYLDPNPVTYAFHTKIPQALSSTFLSLEIKKGLQSIAKKFDLSFLFGTAPQDYFVNRVQYPGNQSLLSLLGDQVMPIALSTNNTRKDIPSIMITNSGSLRFDLFQGEFTKNDQLITSPFDDTFLFIPNVPFSAANQVIGIINSSGQDAKKKRDLEMVLKRRNKMHDVDEVYGAWRMGMWEQHLAERSSAPVRGGGGSPTLGYVTKDSCPGTGDDVPHTPLPFFPTPNFVASPLVNHANVTVTDSTPIDLVFVDFIESDILTITSKLLGKNVTSDDVQAYTPISASEMFGVFAQQAWN